MHHWSHPLPCRDRATGGMLIWAEWKVGEVSSFTSKASVRNEQVFFFFFFFFTRRNSSIVRL